VNKKQPVRVKMPWKVNLVFSFLTLESLGLLFYFLFLPTDAGHFSVQRWMMIAASFLLLVLVILLYAYCTLNLPFLEKTMQLLQDWKVILITIILFGCLLLVTITSGIFLWKINRAYFARLEPFFLFAVAGNVQLLILQRAVGGRSSFLSAGENLKKFLASIYQKFLEIHELSIRAIRWPGAYLCLILPVCAFFLFYEAFINRFPLGYAGLYSLMAETIVKNGFALPLNIPYYGPGGIPFAYPPFALYVMAFFTGVLHLDPMIYLRFAAPLFSWLALIPAFYLAREITHSRVGAALATFILATSGKLFLFHGLSAGMVRSLAFGSALAGLYFFIRTTTAPRRLHTALSVFFFTVTCLSHLGYAVFCVLFALAILVTEWNLKSWARAGLIAVLTAVVVSPWVLTVAARHGWGVFLGAFQSHGNSYFLQFFQNSALLLPWFEEGWRDIWRTPLFCGMILLGAMYLIASRDYRLPLSLVLLTLFTSEGDRFVITVGSMVAGVTAAVFVQKLRPTAGALANRKILLRNSFFLWMLALGLGINGFKQIRENTPLISGSTMDLARFMQKQSDSADIYLFPGDPGEAEWMPYLFQRQPLKASWGSEWKGTYDEQMHYLLEFAACVEAQSYACIESEIQLTGIQPQILITAREWESINLEIAAGSRWAKAYENEGYIAWRYLE